MRGTEAEHGGVFAPKGDGRKKSKKRGKSALAAEEDIFADKRRADRKSNKTSLKESSRDKKEMFKPRAEAEMDLIDE